MPLIRDLPVPFQGNSSCIEMLCGIT